MVKTNLLWEVKKLQRAGHSSGRIAKQVQHKLKRKHAGKLPGGSTGRIQTLAAEALRKQRFHLTKQLHQAMKKAKSFLIRKQMRRAKEEGKAESGDADRLLVLKALPLQEVARVALSSLDMEVAAERKAPKDADRELREWRQFRRPVLCMLMCVVCASAVISAAYYTMHEAQVDGRGRGSISWWS